MSGVGRRDTDSPQTLGNMLTSTGVGAAFIVIPFFSWIVWIRIARTGKHEVWFQRLGARGQGQEEVGCCSTASWNGSDGTRRVMLWAVSYSLKGRDGPQDLYIYEPGGAGNIPILTTGDENNTASYWPVVMRLDVGMLTRRSEAPMIPRSALAVWRTLHGGHRHAARRFCLFISHTEWNKRWAPRPGSP